MALLGWGISPCHRTQVRLNKSSLFVGYDADFAVSQLNIVNKNYAQDAEILTKMQYFAVSAQISVKEASMNEEERNKFYENIPPMMKHYPHIFVIQQQKQQQEVLQKQQKIQEIRSVLTSIIPIANRVCN